MGVSKDRYGMLGLLGPMSMHGFVGAESFVRRQI